MNELAPRVFVSHAGEDKGFVLEFAGSLRDRGINAWVDDWEILPGDRLIDKIFEQGIGECDAFIIILSQSSVKKPWVVEEVDAALVKRIEQDTKIIPIRIDDCEVPVALRATAWINIDPESDYEVELHKVLSSIFETAIKPPIGPRPETFRELRPVGGYNLEETRILEFIVKQQAEKNYRYIDCTQFREAFADLPVEVLNDAIEIFEADLVIEVNRTGGTAPFTFSSVQLRPFGWVQYAARFLDVDAERDIDSILALVVSEGPVSGSVVSERLGIEPVRVNMTVGYLRSVGYVRCWAAMGCAPYSFTEVEATAQGRRAARSQLT